MTAPDPVQVIAGLFASDGAHEYLGEPVTQASHMLQAAEELLRGGGFGSSEEPWLPLGIGIDYGVASVGNVGSGEVKDFTAIGDVVNTAARLQARAEPGQVVMSERARASMHEPRPEGMAVEFHLKGKAEPIAAWVLSPDPSVRH